MFLIRPHDVQLVTYLTDHILSVKKFNISYGTSMTLNTNNGIVFSKTGEEIGRLNSIKNVFWLALKTTNEHID